MLRSDKNDFTKKELSVVLEKLTRSKYGYLKYDQLCDEIGLPQVSALIQKNVLHHRPVSRFARDLVPFPPDRVVTATGTPALRAMELIVNSM